MIRWLATLAVLFVTAAPALGTDPARHLRVRVTLDHGARLTGVVRGGILYESMDRRGRFHRVAGPHVPGAGFRLWYVADSPGYLFVRHRDVRKFEEISKLTSRELFQLERGLRAKADVILLPYRPEKDVPQEEAEEVDDGAAQERPEPGPGEKDEPAPIGPEPPPGLEEPGAGAITEGERLLMEFPPHEGWLPERREEIERRKWVLGVFPTPKEKRFLDHYESWKRAYDAWLRELIRRQAEERRPAEEEPPPEG